MAAAAPLVADPIVRNRGTLVGSLCHADPQGDWAAVHVALGAHVDRAGPGRAAHDPGRASSCIGPVPERAAARRDRRRGGGRRPPTGTATGSYLKLERRVGDFATAGVAVALERSGGTVTRAGIALTGVGPRDDRRHRRRGRAGREAARPRQTVERGGQPAPRRPPSRAATTAAARTTSGTSWPRSCAAACSSPEARRVAACRRSMTSRGPGGHPRRRDEHRITVTVNGERRVVEVEPRLLLAHLLREGLALTGTHLGCDTTNCGACTVLVDGTPVKSCTMLAVQADGQRGHHRRGSGHRERARPGAGGLLASSTACSAASAPPG